MSLFPLQTRATGNCLSEAVRVQLPVKCPEYPADPYFPNRYMKRLFVACLVKNRRKVLDDKRMFLQWTYGSNDPRIPVGPFTFRSYCSYVASHGSWGDDCVLYAFALEYNLAITVVFSHTLDMYGITHPYRMRASDIVLVHNGDDHWSGTGRKLEFLRPHKYRQIYLSTLDVIVSPLGVICPHAASERFALVATQYRTPLHFFQDHFHFRTICVVIDIMLSLFTHICRYLQCDTTPLRFFQDHFHFRTICVVIDIMLSLFTHICRYLQCDTTRKDKR